MNRTRGIQFVGAALALAFFAALAVWGMLKSAEPDRVGVVTAAVDISQGMLLHEKMLTVEKWPAGAVPRGAFRNPGEVAGRTAANGMGRGEAVVEKRLVSPAETMKKTAPESTDGKVAVSLKVNTVSGVSGMLQRGDRVDVMATSKVADRNDARISRVILVGVSVLKVELEGDGKSSAGGSRKDMVVTLSLTREDARILAVADGENLKLIARNPLDPSMEAGDVAVYTVRSGPRTTAQLRADTATKDTEYNGLVERDKRAVTLSYADDDGICGFLRPGNRVDILAVTSAGDVSVESNEPGAEAEHLETETTARIILQNIPVLVVEDEVETKNRSGGSAKSERQAGASDAKRLPKVEAAAGRITLLLSPNEAEKILVAYSSEAIRLKFICRNVSDDGVVITRGQTLVDAFWGDRDPFEVEIFRGSGKDGRAFDFEDPAFSDPPDRSPLPGDPQPMGKGLI